jgi:hypothetical protein
MMHPALLEPRHTRHLVERIRSEYLEMPGLTLTLPQAQRLWGLDAVQCQHILGALVDAGFLRRLGSGYVRASSSR